MSQEIPQIFNSKLLRVHRARAVANFAAHNFLFREMAEDIAARLQFINRKFPLALDLGAHNGLVGDVLQGRGGIEHLVQMELSEPLLRQASGLRVVASEELLPFAENSFDLVVSAGALHWVNDLTGTLIQIQRVLKPDGLFIGVCFGAQTLHELRAAFEKAELDSRGGISPRISPFIDVQNAGSLLQRAGFALPVVDNDIIAVEYEHPLKMMKELRGMGEANALMATPKNFTPCSLMMLAVDNYLRDFSNANGRVDASFELITMTGWKPTI